MPFFYKKHVNLIVCSTIVGFLLSPSAALPQTNSTSVSARNGSSEPLRDIATSHLFDRKQLKERSAARQQKNLQLILEEPGTASKIGSQVSRSEIFRGDVPLDRSVRPVTQKDASAQARKVGLAPFPNIPSSISFDGVGFTGVLPPDPTGEAGLNHYVQAVNLHIGIWDKSGTMLLGPTPINALWSGFGGICETNNNGDPIVLYDQLADRWLISQFALGLPDNFHQCIAISQTGDPTGAYYLYDFFYSDTDFNDYPKFGVWPDGYYMSTNQFDGGTFAFTGGGAVVYEREQMLQGFPAQSVYFDLDPNFPGKGGFLPADLDGITVPAPGTPNFFIRFDRGIDAFLEVYKFAVDWATPANSSFTLAETVPISMFNFVPCGGRACIPQPGGTPLDAIDDRLMFRAAYRNFGDHESLVVNHTVDAGSAVAGVKWYELRDLSTTPSLFQEGVFDGGDLDVPDTDHRWMASLAMDAVGNIGLGYSIASNNTFPSVRYTGRLEGDPLGTMLQGEGEMIAGGGSQSSGSSRWGDYSHMSVDPVDDCTFWYTQEYFAADSAANWSTRIGSFKFENCVTGPTGFLQGTVTDSVSGQAIEGARIIIGGMSTQADVNGNYLIRLPVGDYFVSIEKFGYVDQNSDAVSIDEDLNTTLDGFLAERAIINQSGRVLDGSGHGWPLYAKIVLRGIGGPTEVFFTDPVTGEFSVDIFGGEDYTTEISAVVGGYATAVGSQAGLIDDFEVLVSENCIAPGYLSVGLSADFDNGVFPPPGWTTAGLSGLVWRTNDDFGRGNLTGGEGLAATADSDRWGPSTPYDAELISPEIDIASLENTLLEYRVDYNDIGSGDVLDLDISVDGGAFTTILQYTTDVREMLEQVDLAPQLVGGTTFRLRWRYYNLSSNAWDWWAQIDNVTLATSCQPKAGGLIVGSTTDLNTGAALNGVTLDDGNGSSTFSFATAEDPNVVDGLYVLFSELADPVVSANLAGYAQDSVQVNAIANAIVVAEFDLPAGMLESDTVEITINSLTDVQKVVSLNLSNVGTADLDFEFLEISFHLSDPILSGNQVVGARRFGPKHLNERDASRQRVPFEPLNIPEISVPVQANFPTGLAHPWGLGVSTNTQVQHHRWTNNIAVDGGDDLTYHFDDSGVLQPGTFDDSSILGTDGIFVADMTYNFLTDTFWMVKVGGDNCVYEMDPVALQATGQSLCPGFATSERGLAMDVITQTMFAGSWNDGVIHRFDLDENLLESTFVGLPVAGLAYNPVTQHLFVLSNQSAAATDDVTVLDLSDPANLYQPLYSFDIPDFVNNGQAGMSFDCVNNQLVTVDQHRQEVIEIDLEGVGQEGDFSCLLDVAWLSETPETGIITNAQPQAIDITFDSVDIAGDTSMLASLIVNNSTPYGSINVRITYSVFDSVINIVAADHSISEDGGSIAVELQRGGNPVGALNLDFSLVAGSAVVGDYEDNSDTVFWGDGDSANKTITINIIDDNTEEADKVFQLVLGDVQGNAFIGDQSSIDITILNDDEAGQLSFASSSQSASENVGSIDVAVSRVNGSDGEVSVDYVLSGNSALADSDFTAASGTLVWAHADTADKIISVDILNDSTEENDESFTVNLINEVAPVELGSITTTTITILNDDEAGQISFASSSQSASENVGSIDVAVSRVNGSDGQVSVDYVLSGNSAVAGSDFTAASGTLVWADDDAADKTISVIILNDSTEENNESFTVNLINEVAPVELGSIATTTITITNDDTPPPAPRASGGGGGSVSFYMLLLFCYVALLSRRRFLASSRS